MSPIWFNWMIMFSFNSIYSYMKQYLEMIYLRLNANLLMFRHYIIGFHLARKFLCWVSYHGWAPWILSEVSNIISILFMMVLCANLFFWSADEKKNTYRICNAIGSLHLMLYLFLFFMKYASIYFLDFKHQDNIHLLFSIRETIINFDDIQWSNFE